jgi:hypothetical protein
MTLHRVFPLIVAFTLGTASLSHGQEKLQQKDSDKARLSKAEMSQYQALNALVDAVSTGKEAAPSDVTLKFQNHYIKSATSVFIPYVLEISGGTFNSFPVAMYVRAVRKGGAADPSKATDPSAKATEYPFTDLYIFPNAKSFVSTGPNTTELARALELPAGEFDVYIAMTETPPRNGKTPPKRVVHTHALTVPDLSTGLTTSSIILGKQMEEAAQPTTAREQMEQPYTIGGQRIVPTFSAAFPKSGELVFLYLIYNEGATAAGKPDLDITYTMFRGTEAKPFAKLPPASFNATTLPPEFSLSAGHQVLAAQGFPLASFAPGPYRLEIGIADKVTGQTISRPVPFSVLP